MNICITGGLGYIGRHLINDLCNKGHNVLVIDREDYKDRGIVEYFKDKYSQFTFVHTDIRNSCIADYFKEYEIETVIHLAALTNEQASTDSIRRGVYEVAMDVFNMASISGVKTFINASDSCADSHISEYGFAKYLVEQNMLIKEDGPDLYNLRLFNLYGHSNIIPFSKHKTGLWFNAVHSQITGDILTVATDCEDRTTKDWINIFDAVEIISRFALKDPKDYIKRNFWEIGSGIGISEYLFIKHFITIEDINIDVEYVPCIPGTSKESISNPSETFKHIEFKSKVGPKLYSNSYLNGVYVS